LFYLDELQTTAIHLPSVKDNIRPLATTTPTTESTTSTATTTKTTTTTTNARIAAVNSAPTLSQQQVGDSLEAKCTQPVVSY
jgi:hypothetical protein